MNCVPTPSSLSISMVPPRSSTAVRTTSSPTPRPDVAVTSSRVLKPALEQHRHQRLPSGLTVCRQQASLDWLRAAAPLRQCRSRHRRPRSRSSSLTARADTVTVDCAGLPAASRSAGVSQPWSTALVTRWRRASATPSSTRVSSSTSSPTNRSRTSLPVSACYLANKLREGSHNATRRHHCQPHRAIANLRKSVLGVLHRATHLTNGRLELVTQCHERMQVLRDFLRHRDVGRRQLADRPRPREHARLPAR